MATQQPGSWMDHKYLALMKGIGATPTDNLSAENPIASISLLTGAVSLTLDGWTPKIPTVKNGGVWSDSPISDGRQLLAAPVGNITETMTVIVKGDSYLQAQQNFVALGQMAADCRDYWQGIAQIDPVYLMWAAGCNIPALPQYALLYNIELAPEYLDGPTPSIRVAMTLERESYWRGLPPGANPKLWTFYVNNQAIGLGSKVLADATLVTGSDHLITQTIANKAEWTQGSQTSFRSQNFIDITAAQVPGDAPALVEFGMDNNVNINNLYVSLTTKKMSGTGHDNVLRAYSLILNAPDGDASSLIGFVGGTAANGVRAVGSGVGAFAYGQRTVTAIDGAFITGIEWGAGGSTVQLDREFYRGTYALFCRMSNHSAVAPLLADMRARILIEEFADTPAAQFINSVTLPDVNPPIETAGTGKQLVYMGTVTIPFEQKTVQSPLGYGLQLKETKSNIRITLQLKVDVATANRTFEIIDLIFMPIDEGMAQVAQVFNTSGVASTTVFDNTGYLTRGELKQIATSFIGTAQAVTGGVGQEIRGQNIMLKPRTNQRLYFIFDGAQNPSISQPDYTMAVKLNIVPRWSGIRDV